jgi:hypothetical protein
MATSHNIIDTFPIELTLKNISKMEGIFRKEKFYSMSEELSDLKFQLLQKGSVPAGGEILR